MSLPSATAYTTKSPAREKLSNLPRHRKESACHNKQARGGYTDIAVAASCKAKGTCPRRALDRPRRGGVNFIGGFSPSCTGLTPESDHILIAHPGGPAGTERVCSSVNVATPNRTNMDAARQNGEICLKRRALPATKDSIGCAKLVVFANSPRQPLHGRLHSTRREPE